jgi:hypothetical protein
MQNRKPKRIIIKKNLWQWLGVGWGVEPDEQAMHVELW